MGTVLEAYDPTLRRTVALKLLHRELAESHGRRLLKEARALARLSHPNVVHVHEAGQIDDRAFIAMELVRGESLLDWQRRPRAWSETIDAYLQAGRGLAAAHAAGLIHRDFKPTNCMIDADGQVHVLDFGLVRDLHTGDSTRSLRHPPTRSESLRLAKTLTRTGAVVGTLVYMSPEQLCGRDVDAKSDQYSFCAALYEALYGALPFDGQSIGELLSAVMGDRPPTIPRGAKVPAHIRKAIIRGLSSDPRRRWRSMDALLAELSRTSRATGWWLAGAVTLTAAGTVIAWSSTTPQPANSTCTVASLRWDDESRAEIRAALTGHDLPYGEHAWTQVHHRLDRYADEWDRQRTTICGTRAPADSPSDGPHHACLDQARRSMQAAVEVLTQADATTTARAVTVVAALPSLDDCRRRPIAERGDPPVQLAVTRAAMWLHAGHPEAARRALHSEPTQQHPRAHYLWARVHRAQDESSEARDALVRAMEQARDSGDARTTMQALAELAAVPEPYDPEDRWLDEAKAEARRPDLPPALAAALMQGVATRLEQRGDRPASIEWRQHALDRWVEAHRDDPMHPAIAEAHAALARSLRLADSIDEAIDHYHRALVRTEAALGPMHPALTPVLLELADAEHSRAQPRAAQRHAQRALVLAADDPAAQTRARTLLATLDGGPQAIR